MLDQGRRRKGAAADTRVSPFAAQIDSFALHLAQLGYAESTIPARMRLVGTFSRWLAPRGSAVAVLGTASVTEFLHQRRRQGARRRGEIATLEQCRRILAIPTKRYERRPIAFLCREEIDALQAAPDVTTWIGRRDRLLLVVAVQTGLRVSELIHLRRTDVVLRAGAHVRCEGKGRKQRCTPLTPDTVAALTTWLREQDGQPTDPLFPGVRGGVLSRDAVERLVHRHTTRAAQQCATLAHKRVTPHVLRHTAAMELLHHGVDRAVIGLWLGHESVETTQMYLHADMRLKEQALARMAPTTPSPGRYRPDDQLLTFLESL